MSSSTNAESPHQWAARVVEQIVRDIVSGQAFQREASAVRDPASVLLLITIAGYSPYWDRSDQEDLHLRKQLPLDDGLLMRVLGREGAVFVSATEYMLRQGASFDVVARYLAEQQRWPMAVLIRGTRQLAEELLVRHQGAGTSVDSHDCSSAERYALHLVVTYHRPQEWTGRQGRRQGASLAESLGLTAQLQEPEDEP